MEQCNTDQKALDARLQHRLDERAIAADIKGQTARLIRGLDKISDNIAETIDDVAWVNNQIMREKAERFAGVIALEMGLEYIRVLAPIELARMVRQGIAGRLPTSGEKSFCYADVVIEATDGETQEYIAVEASFTADARDTNRALRNANMLTQYTGRPARAAIVSVRNDHSINWQIESGAVHWYQIDEEDIEPD